MDFVTLHLSLPTRHAGTRVEGTALGIYGYLVRSIQSERCGSIAGIGRRKLVGGRGNGGGRQIGKILGCASYGNVAVVWETRCRLWSFEAGFGR